MSTDPTRVTYEGLGAVYDYFNAELFENRLPRCLITMQRSKAYYGYFAGGRFGARDGSDVTDEIALNPTHFRSRSVRQCLSTLAHEMTHLEQAHFGRPSRNGYHNKAWGDLMRRIGLEPSSTGAPGGKTTGQKVSHYIVEGGRFDRACEALESDGFTLRYVDLWGDTEAAKKVAAKKVKTKYTCPSCAANAWAKPKTNLYCGDCEQAMEAQEAEDEDC